jgi:hypothetical protein
MYVSCGSSAKVSEMIDLEKDTGRIIKINVFSFFYTG